MEIGPRMDPKIKMPFCRIDVEPRAYQNVRRTGLDSYEADVLFGLSATPVESYSPIQLLDMLEVDGPTGNVAKSVVEVLKFSMEARRNVIARYDPVENMLFNKLQDAAQRMLQILACAHSVTDVLPAEGFKEGYSMQYPYKRLFVDSFINHSPRLLEMIQEFYEPDNFALGPTEMSRTYIGVPRLMIKKDADQDRS